MIKVLFFAQLREQLGNECVELSVELPASIATIRNQLMQQFPQQQQRFEPGKTLVAVNQELISDENLQVNSADEVAFFPPVTGG